MILTDGEIEAKMQERINSEWPPAMREKALRLGGALLSDLNAFFEAMTAEKAAMVVERDLLIAVQDYDTAVTRLALPSVTEGEQEQLDADTAERDAAQAVVDGASAEVLARIEARAA